MVEPSARFEEFKIPLSDEPHGLEGVSAVLGVPRWWPTGSRVSIVLAHGRNRSMDEPMLAFLHQRLTERRYLTLRFNFPFAEAGKRRPDSPAALRRTFRAAIGALGRDPTAAPAHLFLGGFGLGSQVAAELAGARVRSDGVMFFGYPLHEPDQADETQADVLYRIIAPMLFVQGTRDKTCDLDALRQTLTRVGAPTTLQVVQEADHNFKVLKKSGRTPEEVQEEILGGVDNWIQKVLGS